MEKLIRVGNLEVVQGLCMVEFILVCDLDEFQYFSVTHSKLYKLLETATDVKIANGGKQVTFKQGVIKYTAFKKI